MARVEEQKLVCSACGGDRELPMCCGKVMEVDGEILYCSNCHREISLPSCCGRRMMVLNTRRDIKKEIFGLRP